MNEQRFREILTEKGYGEARVREWEANFDKEMHIHDLSAMALVTSGALTLVYKNNSVTYGPGEACELVAGTLHTEQTGPDGAVTLLAYK